MLYFAVCHSNYDDHRFLGGSPGSSYRPGGHRPGGYRPGDGRPDGDSDQDMMEHSKKLASSTRVMADLIDSAKTNRVVRPGGVLGNLFGESGSKDEK